MKHATSSHQRAAGRSIPGTGRTAWLRTVVLAASLVAAVIGQAGAQANSSVSPAEPSACATYGGWIDVKTGRSIDREGLFRDLAAKNAVVLLGESHTDVDHHLWQLHTLAAL